jgi:hypothetical protein
MARLKSKLEVAAADRYVLDLTLLGEDNANRVLTYFSHRTTGSRNCFEVINVIARHVQCDPEELIANFPGPVRSGLWGRL